MTSHDIILHHYPMSPFAEKARLLLGHKQLEWRSVTIPRIMPKPDVVALTGGYRRTPILQVGADIYCDTALIARKLELLKPTPTLYPPHIAAANHALSQWADSTLFGVAVVIAFQPTVIAASFSSEDEMKIFVADRAALRKGASSRRMPLAEAKPSLAVFLTQLNTQLSDGRRYLFGDATCAADFSVYHPLWFVRVRPLLAAELAPFKNVLAWMDRVAAIGHGQSAELDSAEAVDIAKRSAAVSVEAESDLEAFKVGDAVEVLPTDYGLDPVAGELVVCNAEELVVRRRDARAGEVSVHFPRLNYELRKPTPA
ncbi:MAG TPA: glutathione S-transferase family protein [Steroidobacteraceae bacterium]|nr:glutathione S-transferase family protein [Steroidobacteraceae bacterium]